MQLQDRFDIIPHLYEKFSKADMALLCKDIASCKAQYELVFVSFRFVFVSFSGQGQEGSSGLAPLPLCWSSAGKTHKSTFATG